MLNPEIKTMIQQARQAGWVMEPDAKKIMCLAGLDVPRFYFVKSAEEARQKADELGFPLVAKIVSPQVIHKSDVGGVIVGIQDQEALQAAYQRLGTIDGFSGVLIEEMVAGLELIVGAKIDHQFGPVILLGMGGTAVEIYQDAVFRMAPLKERDVLAMVKALKAHRLFEGFRGAPKVDLPQLTQGLLAFSSLVMDLAGEIESIDLNPVKCSAQRCMVADARIMLANP